MALSLGANFSGNGTLIGSSAAIIAIRLAEKLHYGITFNRFIKSDFHLCSNCVRWDSSATC